MAEKDKPESDEATELVVPGKKPSALSGPLPIMLGMLIGVPLVCYLMIQFLVLPKLLAAVEHASEAAAAPAGKAAPGGKAASGGKAAAGQHGAAAKEQTYDFGKIMVNVASAGDSRYLRVNLVLASNNPEIKEIAKSNDVALRDAIITVLSAQNLSDLEKNDGRDAARRALLARINGILGSEIVQQIYFTDFVIQ